MLSIIGMSPSTRHLIPEDSEKWALTLDAEYASRADRLFEMHDRGLLEDDRAQYPEDFFKVLSGRPQPIYMQKHWEDIPASVKFPFDEVEQTVFSGFPRGRWDSQTDWYNSSIAYMIALAIHEEKYFGIYGVDVLSDSEYNYESPCLEYLIGLAVGKGLKVIIPEGPTHLGKFRDAGGIRLGPGTFKPIYKRRYGYI